MWDLTKLERSVFPPPQSSSSSSGLNSLVGTGTFSPLLHLFLMVPVCLLSFSPSITFLRASVWVNVKIFFPFCACAAASTQSPPSLRVYPPPPNPPLLCYPLPLPPSLPLLGFRLNCHWVACGVMVVVSASDDSAACTGLLLHMRRALHGAAASSWAYRSRTQTYPAGFRSSRNEDHDAAGGRKPHPLRCCGCLQSVLTSFWRWFLN